MPVENKQLATVNRLKDMLNVPSVMEQFHRSLGENAGSFTASLIEMLSSDTSLQRCDPKDLILEALKAASLKLPINKNLGFAWIIPRKIKGVLKPQFQIGYRGYYQLAQRTGLYRFINTRTVPAGWTVQEDFKTGEIKFLPGPANSAEDHPVGYFACFVQLNGFSKEIFRSYEWMLEHVKKFVPGWNEVYSPWYSDFNGMAEKTVGSHLIGKYGILSTEYQNLQNNESLSPDAEAKKNENSEDFDILQNEVVNEATGEIISETPIIQEPQQPAIPEEFL